MAETNALEPSELTLGGRTFRVGPYTQAQVDWLRNWVWALGLDRFTLLARELPSALINRASEHVGGFDELCDLYTGMLMHKEMHPEAWTPELARQTSAFLRRLTGERDKDALLCDLAEFVRECARTDWSVSAQKYPR